MHFKLVSYFQTACRKDGFGFYPHQLLLLYESSLFQDILISIKLIKGYLLWASSRV